ncbi:lipoprotein lipase-like [Macrosteles quadrilineatus]|uniref:lipoprotein lipase-like n=1 Tax=Macrosteles quadrilineatus TaxID=74068 RepID=UPI0023E0C3A2|nr:lipoprotein lipase-like [Macrosteles quadrilineatus]
MSLLDVQSPALTYFEQYSKAFCALAFVLVLPDLTAKEKRRCLDAFQYNHDNPYFKPVSKEDAMFVHMFHTSGKLTGTQARIGTVDIVINNGYFQPGCGKQVNKGVGCSHRRSVAVFLLSLVATGSVVARRCDSWEDFNQCKCSDPANPLLVVSFPVNEEVTGTFYVRTKGILPFVLSSQGAYCEAEAKVPHFYKK